MWRHEGQFWRTLRRSGIIRLHHRRVGSRRTKWGGAVPRRGAGDETARSALGAGAAHPRRANLVANGLACCCRGPRGGDLPGSSIRQRPVWEKRVVFFLQRHQANVLSVHRAPTRRNDPERRRDGQGPLIGGALRRPGELMTPLPPGVPLNSTAAMFIGPRFKEGLCRRGALPKRVHQAKGRSALDRTGFAGIAFVGGGRRAGVAVPRSPAGARTSIGIDEKGGAAAAGPGGRGKQTGKLARGGTSRPGTTTTGVKP